jgi:beta-phosphoglucomutase
MIFLNRMINQYCVIFDMDGVLADTGAIHYESWVKTAKEIGKEFSMEFFKSTFGQQSIPITRSLLGDNVSEELINEFANKKEYYYRQMVKDKLKPLPGVISLLNDLKKLEIKIALGSSGPQENVNLLLDMLNIRKFFDIIITADDVKQSKPSPEVFLIISKRLDLDPRNCLVIEDAPVGIEAARRVNMKTIALRTTHDDRELLNADLVVEDLSYVSIDDILELIHID